MFFERGPRQYFVLALGKARTGVQVGVNSILGELECREVGGDSDKRGRGRGRERERKQIKTQLICFINK